MACEMVTVSIPTETEAIMKESGREDLKKEMENTNTKMGIGTKESGNKALNTVRAPISTKKPRRNIKEAGKMAIFMGKEHFITKMDQCIKVHGRMTSDMEKG